MRQGATITSTLGPQPIKTIVDKDCNGMLLNLGVWVSGWGPCLPFATVWDVH